MSARRASEGRGTATILRGRDGSQAHGRSSERPHSLLPPFSRGISMKDLLVVAWVAASLLLAALGGPAQAAQTNVAVAANFTDAAKAIAAAFKARTGHDAVLSFGSSGALYTQITQ